MKCLLLILALMVPQIALARIGETYEQCVERYGKGKKSAPYFQISIDNDGVRDMKGVDIIFTTKNYLIRGYFLDRVCHGIEYRDATKKLSVDVAERILEKSYGITKYTNMEVTGPNVEDVLKHYHGAGVPGVCEYITAIFSIKAGGSLVLWSSVPVDAKTAARKLKGDKEANIEGL